tara:strand:- start:964 stop:1104 length:141 start_codon:yes stop_codon:yes gene_type:complete
MEMSLYCPECGEQVDEYDRYRWDDTISCPNCGEVLTIGDLIERDSE